MKFYSLTTVCILILSSVGWAESGPRTRAEAVPSKDSLTLAFPGVKGPIPYEKFGQFEEIGTPRYRYTMSDRPGLAKAAGEGIYPNTDAIKDPTYKKLIQEKKLNGNHWRF